MKSLQTDLLAQARDVLQHIWGYDDFRSQQADIVTRVAGGEDALVLMPTGGGKSLCYQVPALMRPGTAIVISPLISLIPSRNTASAGTLVWNASDARIAAF